MAMTPDELIDTSMMLIVHSGDAVLLRSTHCRKQKPATTRKRKS